MVSTGNLVFRLMKILKGEVQGYLLILKDKHTESLILISDKANQNLPKQRKGLRKESTTSLEHCCSLKT